MKPETATVKEQNEQRKADPLPRRVGLRSTGMLMTAEEFDATPPHRWNPRFRYEIINGVLVVSPRPSPAERDPNEELGHWLRSCRDAHPNGSSLDSTLPEQTVFCTPQRRHCDRAIWAGRGRSPDADTDVPTIVVEFVSSAKKDRVRDNQTKRDEYRTAGIRESWIINRFRRTMTVHRFAAKKRPIVVGESGSCATEFLPGFIRPLGRLLRTADSWERPARKRPRARGDQS
jgi:Uma2 family endonuclease